jgi:hypothetical protein
MSAVSAISPVFGCETCTRYDYVNGISWCKQKRDGIIYCSKIPYEMRKYGCSDHSSCKNAFIIQEIKDLVDGRIAGLENLMNTPPDQRTESAQDDKLREALFQLTLVRDLIKDLTKGEL